jgi:NAD(P)-dependent dehydrogenase (short-subunit alcohol dehydrogenase family)
MGKLEGKVAFITGAARGQGRSHAIRLAQEGADIIALDICRQIDSVTYPMSTPDDLAETVKQVEALDRRIFSAQADVRDETQLRQVFERGVAEIGPVDISNAILWLVSDDARYVTGVTLPVDAGFTNKK